MLEKLLENYQPRDNHFLVFQVRQGCGGLGDRIIGLSSAFVLALLTNRHFRIDWQTPFPLRMAWEPASDEIPWNNQDSIKDEPFLIDAFNNIRKFGHYFREENFFLNEHKVITVKANQHFFTYLLQNPFLKIKALNIEPQNAPALQSEILSCLFRPTPRLANTIRQFAQRIGRKNSIGIQIRTLKNFGDNSFGHLKKKNLRKFYNCARSLFSRERENIVFISADDRETLEDMAKMFDGVEIFTLPYNILHTDKSRWHNEKDYLGLFLNLHLLAACEHLIISRYSSFGRVAAFLRGSDPWTIRHNLGLYLPVNLFMRRFKVLLEEPFRRISLSNLVSKEPIY